MSKSPPTYEIAIKMIRFDMFCFDYDTKNKLFGPQSKFKIQNSKFPIPPTQNLKPKTILCKSKI